MEKDDDFTDWLIAREECIMDLDDEELKATRKLNGVAKESNIEEDIKRCEKLIEPQNANWIGITNQLAIAHLIEKVKELRAMCEEYCPKTERIKELEEENGILEFQNKQLENYVEELKKYNKTVSDRIVEYKKNSIPKQKVKDKIEELNNNRPYLMKFEDWRKKEYTNEDIIQNCIEVLEELLEDK